MAERLDPDKISNSLKGKILNWLISKENPYVKNLERRYELCNKYIKNKIILDIPCGMGWGTSFLKGYQKSFGIDISEEAVVKAKKRYPGEKITFLKGDMTNFSSNFDYKFFDVIICLEGFEHITFLQGEAFLEESKKSLKKGGLLILSTPLLIDNKFHSGNKYHLCEYKEKEFFQILAKKGFTVKNKIFFNTAEKSKMIVVVLQK